MERYRSFRRFALWPSDLAARPRPTYMDHWVIETMSCHSSPGILMRRPVPEARSVTDSESLNHERRPLARPPCLTKTSDDVPSKPMLARFVSETDTIPSLDYGAIAVN